MKKMRKSIIVLSNSNYVASTGGTEKFIKNLSKNYQNNNYSFINFFATLFSENIFGLNINDKFKGIYKIDDMYKIIKNLEYQGYSFEGILIQHIKGFNLFKLADQLNKSNLNIIIEIHDFYFICNTFNFLKNKKDFCGLTLPNELKCKNCHNYKKIFQFIKERNYFLETLENKIEKIYFPSEFCMKKWINFFPKFKNKSFVRENLSYFSTYKKEKVNDKIRIGYLGRKNIHKGYEVWNRIVNDKNLLEKYEFYYFGIDINHDNSFVHEIYTNGDAVEKLREYNIDIVVLLSIIPETYSYSYYEASSSGALIISTEQSGNISCMIKKNKNGLVFEDENSLINNLKNLKIDYNMFNKFSPLKISDNTSLKEFEFKKKNNTSYSNKKYLVVKRYLLTLFYKIKKRVRR